MIDSPEVAGDYYQKIADRIAVSALLYPTFVGYDFHMVFRIPVLVFANV